ncbi:Protein kinase domain [Carpediemonas membranifera]|uniref:non-specific serine/threonine protein kinase n=1 Tax=Carpediemonas membranifera TaxID=201153 RepID=A0A8J6BAS2_9EUKA|nr:Protein kinase domain [Carpediemonas membranifera]|eukprot:KAG9396347.1 Protein kinase domain [Carpediemonas membranifera]
MYHNRGAQMVGDYRLERTLGKGSFAKVKQAVHSKTGERVAIKIISTKDANHHALRRIKTEISVLRLLSHPNVIQLKEVFASESRIFLVMELVSGGELLDRLAVDRVFPVDVARKYMIQLLSAIDHCHKKGIVHRDLKPENILLDEHGNAKVSDFGLSALYEQGFRATVLATACGSPHYVAPEVVSRGTYDGRAADIWSMGVLLFVMLTGTVPFSAQNIKALFTKIKGGSFVIPDHVPADARSLIERLIVVNPADRATMEEVAAHPFLHGKLGVLQPTAPVVPEMGDGSLSRVIVTDHVMDAVLSLLGSEDKGASLPSLNAFDLMGMCGIIGSDSTMLDASKLVMVTAGSVCEAMPLVVSKMTAMFGKDVRFVQLTHLGKLKCTVDLPNLITVRFNVQFYNTAPTFTMGLFIKQQGPRLEFLRTAYDVIAAIRDDSAVETLSSDTESEEGATQATELMSSDTVTTSEGIVEIDHSQIAVLSEASFALPPDSFIDVDGID